MKADLVRAQKWVLRGDDWTRLATHAREDHVAGVCEKFAVWAYDMARFWGWS